MKRYECLELLAPLITNQLTVASVSTQWMWGHLSKHEGNLLLGSMGNALGVALGMALSLPHRKVLALETDGSLLLSLYNLPTVAAQNPANLAVIVFDNQAYSGSRISQPSATAGKTDLAAMAQDAGIDDAVTVRELGAFKKEAVAALEKDGLRLIVAKIEESTEHRQIPRSDMDLMENKYRFIRYVERTEGQPVFFGRG